MKRLILTTILVLAAGVASAQLSVRVGFANANWHNDAGQGSNYPGATVGAGYELPLNAAKSLSLRPGLTYTYTSQTRTMKGNRNVESSATEHALGLPVHVKFALPIGKNARIYAFAGPSLGYGLGYRIKETFTLDPLLPSPSPVIINIEGTLTSDLYRGTVEGRTSDPDLVAERQAVAVHLNRFDVALSGGAGVQWRRVFVEAGYDYGLLNRSKKSGTVNREQLNVVLGYNF